MKIELNNTDVAFICIEYEKIYTDKKIRDWWIKKKECKRRLLVRNYFKGYNSESINTLYGIMPEEMEEIYFEQCNTIT